MKYGESVEVNCSALVPHVGMGWEATVGNKGIEEDAQLVTWKVKKITRWDVSAMCFINPQDGEQCLEPVTVIVYSK